MEQADTEKIVDYILSKEGGISHNPHDLGGSTAYGISRRFHPEAWENGPPSIEQAREIWKGYVNQWQIERWPTRIACKMTDLLCPRNVMIEAIQVLQRALWAASGHPIKVDGVYGPVTNGRMEDQCRYVAGELMLLACLRAEIAATYRLFVAKTPSQEPNIAGWLNRSYS